MLTFKRSEKAAIRKLYNELLLRVDDAEGILVATRRLRKDVYSEDEARFYAIRLFFLGFCMPEIYRGENRRSRIEAIGARTRLSLVEKPDIVQRLFLMFSEAEEAHTALIKRRLYGDE